ncbi:hypothetical protein TRIUR3_27597 [Triticum urartu]|uniref:Uncharacterized protein n=1 Tax=Triticum urartu TaxID=4572 RepID=M7YYV3_TRIUA|nr:hypothetical protein TRIUR3_27597 [Triticum urartu]
MTLRPRHNGVFSAAIEKLGGVVQEVTGGDAGVQNKTEFLEQGKKSEAGGSGVFPRRCQWKSADLGPGQHGVVPQPACHIDMCLAACGGPGLQLVKPVRRWCFPGFGEDGGRASLSATLEGFCCSPLQLVKPVRRWCFPGFGEDGGRASLSATLEKNKNVCGVENIH